MRFSTTQPPFSWGIALPARTLYVGSLRQDGEVGLPRNRQAKPDAWLQAIAPYRNAIGVAVAGLFPWDGLAALGTREHLPCGLGPALSMQALHGGKATNDRIDAHKIAVVLRGGRLPQASGSPAERRATRDRLRRRMPLLRTRAARLAHVHHTHRQYPWPESGTTIAYPAPRAGGAARFPDPAGHTSLAVALAWLASSDRRRTALDLSIVPTARPQDAHPLSRLQTVPGMGHM